MNIIALLILSVFITITISWVVMMFVMKSTTGELKHFITPNNLVKILAIIVVSLGVIVLASEKLVSGESVITILAGIIGYTLGTSFEKKDN
ncbi:MAG TPA: hypothetical protein PKI16_00045 [Candidatus Dojkabacteria bacterium]|jgi:hypothetical protein|nr:hypothetical protein [Candidatus Dojkabacteria bacterium]